MKTGLGVLSLLRLSVFCGGLTACGHAGKMVVDTPIVPYKPPDISDITGIDPDDDTGSGSQAAGSGSQAPGK